MALMLSESGMNTQSAAEWTGKYMAKKGEQYRAGMEPGAEPVNISPAIRHGVFVLHKGGKLIGKVTRFLLDKIGDVGIAVGQRVAGSVNGESVGGRAFRSTATVIGAFSTVWIALEDASKTLKRNMADETVQTVQLRYGDEASLTAHHTLYALGHTTLAGFQLYELGPRSIAGRMARKAGLQMVQKKRLIDLHTNVATALLDNIKTRKLDVLFETEEKLLTGQEIPIVETLRDSPDKEDIMRLILIAACFRSMSSRPNSANFRRSSRSVQSFRMLCILCDSSDPLPIWEASHSSRFVMEGVKNLVPKKHNLPLTKVVEQLTTDVKSGVGVVGITGGSSDFDPDQFRLFDPKLLQGSAPNRDVRPTHAAADVIVFVIGGGNYVEYQNVQEWAKARGLQRCTYG
uniref:Senescence domain-containing protein n=1 Tax=Globodera rostochiensis TaxID=31243 RepID=A0A914IFJ8_GLORO